MAQVRTLLYPQRVIVATHSRRTSSSGNSVSGLCEPEIMRKAREGWPAHGRTEAWVVPDQMIPLWGACSTTFTPQTVVPMGHQGFGLVGWTPVQAVPCLALGGRCSYLLYIWQQEPP